MSYSVKAGRRITMLIVYVWTTSVAGNVYGAITPTGDVSPAYNSTDDPWDAGNGLYVGDDIPGALTIDNGSLVESNKGYVGYHDDGVVVVSGPGSVWVNHSGWFDATLDIGYSGHGTLMVEAGGSVSNAKGYLGSTFGSSGEATVTGVGSIWTTTRDLLIGIDGTGRLDIDDEGVVSVGEETQVGTLGAGNGSIHFDNGTLETGGLVASPNTLHGTGTINTNTIFSDIDIVMDAATGPQQQIVLSNLPGQNVTINIDATDPTGYGTLGVGHHATGSLTIADGLTVYSRGGTFGSLIGSSGTATVKDAGTLWTINGDLTVGDNGTGVLHLQDSGHVLVKGRTWVTTDAGDGAIVFDGGSLQTSSLVATPNDLLGTGTIDTYSILTDLDIVFDATHGPQQQIVLNGLPGQNITINLGQSIPLASAHHITGAGLRGQGSLRIADGETVSGHYGYLGYHEGSHGTAIVTGAGSRWISTYTLQVGNFGTGELTIEDGGQVTCSSAGIGRYSNGSNSVTVSGSGSTWDITDGLWIGGSYNQASLLIEYGGTVSSSGADINGPTHDTRVTVTGQDSSWNTGGLRVGFTQYGQLRIEAGGTVSSGGSAIGYDNTSSGIVTVTGSNSIWTNASGLKVGDKGAGTLRIENGGTVSNTYGHIGIEVDAIGDVVVTGAGSSWTMTEELLVGDAGTGTLRIEAGAHVASHTSHIGVKAGSSGTVVVSGPGSLWTIDLLEGTGSLVIGNRGSSTQTIGSGGSSNLIVENGGTVINRSFGAGLGDLYADSASATVRGTDSQWINTGRLSIGGTNVATLYVESGGTVQSSSATVAGARNTIGEVYVTGPGSEWIIDSDLHLSGLVFSAEGTALLALSDGGRVDVGNELHLYRYGRLVLDGGELFAKQIKPHNTSIEFFSGTLKTDDYWGSLDQIGGTLVPGYSNSELTIHGSYTQHADATLSITLRGSGVPGTDYDHVETTGLATLNGILDLQLADGFSPVIGDEFDIMTLSGGYAGWFREIRLPDLPGIGLSVSYGSNTITLNVGLLGDLNGDGFVGIADLNILLPAWNQNVTPGNLSAGDVTGDGFVGIEDLNAVLGNWNLGTPPPVVVPEPASMTVLLIGLIVGSHRRKRTVA